MHIVMYKFKFESDPYMWYLPILEGASYIFCYFWENLQMKNFRISLYEPLRQKTGLQGFRPDPTQTGLYSHRR